MHVPKTGLLSLWCTYTEVTHYTPDKRSSPDNHRVLDKIDAYFGPGKVIGALTQADVVHWRDAMRVQGLAASTINTRLCVLAKVLAIAAEYGYTSQVGKMPFVSRQRVLKWWLTPEAWQKELEPWLVLQPWGEDMADYIEWTLETGLRVEETLRLLPSDFPQATTLEVPGTKSVGSAVRIGISDRAAAIVNRRRQMHTDSGTIFNPTAKRIFDVPYHVLKSRWNACRKVLGVEDNPTATLKSLRRSFAARCILQKAIPGPLLKELMRHSNMATTMEYLKLVGFTDNDETRALLNRTVGGRLGPVADRVARSLMGQRFTPEEAERLIAEIKIATKVGGPTDAA